MEHFYLYSVLALLGIGYATSVLSCAFSGTHDEWWEPFVFGAILPFWMIYERRIGIALCAAAAFAVWLFVWICIGCARIFHWIGSVL